MAKNDYTFDDFLAEVSPDDMEFVTGVHKFMQENGCGCKLALAKNGLVVSYDFGEKKRVVMNYVFRKSGMFVRLYADFIGAYASILETLPESMKTKIAKSPICKRLAGTADCSSRCVMGYTFALDGENYKKCRYNCFLLPVNAESRPFLKEMIESEIKARNAE